MKKKDIVQALCDYFEISLEEWGWEVTDANCEDILQSYDFISWCYLGYGGPRLSLKDVVKAIEPLTEDYW